MENEQIQKKIEAKLDGLEESLKYQLESQCELLSGLQTVRYLMYLAKSEEKASVGWAGKPNLPFCFSETLSVLKVFL